MASNASKIRDAMSDEAEIQIARLQKEVSALRRQLSKRGSAAYDEASDRAGDLYEEVIARIGDAVPHITRQSRVVGKAASDNPVTTAVIGLALVGLLVGLFSRR